MLWKPQPFPTPILQLNEKGARMVFQSHPLSSCSSLLVSVSYKEGINNISVMADIYNYIYIYMYIAVNSLMVPIYLVTFVFFQSSHLSQPSKSRKPKVFNLGTCPHRFRSPWNTPTPGYTYRWTSAPQIALPLGVEHTGTRTPNKVGGERIICITYYMMHNCMYILLFLYI